MTTIKSSQQVVATMESSQGLRVHGAMVLQSKGPQSISSMAPCQDSVPLSEP